MSVPQASRGVGPMLEIAAADDPARLAAAARRAIFTLPRVHVAAVGFPSGSGETCSVALYARESENHFLEYDASPGLGIAGWVLREGGPLHLRRLDGDPRAGRGAEAVLPPGAAALHPLKEGAVAIGVIGAFRAVGPAFEQWELDFLRSVAGAVEAVYSNLRARRRQDLQVKRLTALAEISRVLAGATDPATVLMLVVDMVMNLVPAHACWLFLKESTEEEHPRLSVARGVARNALDRLQPGMGCGEGVFHSVDVRLEGAAVGSLELMSRENLAPDELDVLQTLANLAAVALHQVRLRLEQKETLNEVVAALAAAIEARDPYTQGHSQRVGEYADWLGRALNMPEEAVERLRLAGYLHDVGKIGVSEGVLNKPGRFSPEELAEMRKHPVIGHHIISHVAGLRDLLPLVRGHHERLDGSGYPDGLRAPDIPVAVRILAICDVFEALTSDRPYRQAITVEEALQVLEAGSGREFDADLVNLFVEAVRVRLARGDFPFPLRRGSQVLGAVDGRKRG